VSAAGFTSGQRRTIILLVVAVVAVFAMLAGFIVTSLQGVEDLPVAVTPSSTPVSSNSPASAPPDSTSPPSPAMAAPTFESAEGIWSQVQAARLFDQIAHQVETLRDLAPRAEVPLSFLDGGEMTTLLRRFYSGRDLKLSLLPYIVLGLLPDASVRVRPPQTVGLYVPESEQLYVNADQQASSADDQALLAHAYIQALQDQHFDLGAMDARATTTDARLAVRALIEGDSSLATAFYRYGGLAETDWDYLAALILRSEQPDYGEDLASAWAWERLQRFPYWEGRAFVQALYEVEGWQAVNRAYVSPPRSTEEVLHPERYLGERSGPAPVTVPDLGTVLDEDGGWSVVVPGDTLGELTIGLYLEMILPEEVAWRAADGWSGDTFLVWEHEDGSRLFVWRTIWDSTTEAAEFESALTALIPQYYLPAWPVDPPRGLGGRWWEINGEAVYVGRVARYVAFAQGPGIDMLTRVVERLP
jgi:hypothetical protein